MQNERFRYITNENIINANNAAQKLVKELNKLNISYLECRELYYSFLEIHSILYDKSNKDANYIYKQINKILYNLRNNESFCLKENSNSYNCFWDILLTSDSKGNICDVNDFMKNCRTKFGDKNELIDKFNYIIRKLYPEYKEIKLQSYKFEFGFYKKLYTIYFNGRIPKEEINNLIKKIKGHNCEKFSNIIKLYLDQYHLEYSNFKCTITSLSQQELRKFYNSLTDYMNDYLNEHIENVDNYYVILNDGGWEDEDYSWKCICVANIVKENSKFDMKYHIIGQTEEMDDYEDDVWGYFDLIIKNENNDRCNKIIKDKIIIPYFKSSSLFDLLLNIDNIETIDQINNIIKK